MGKKGSYKRQIKTIICDSGPIIHLYEGNLLYLLQNIGEVYLPHSVYLEIENITDLNINWPKWLKIISLSPSDIKEAQIWAKVGDLHIGEAEALLLAWKQKADWFVTDDSTARLFASLLDIEAHGSLGILLWNVAKGYLMSEEAEDALKRRRNTSLWLSEKVFEEARKALIDMIS